MSLNVTNFEKADEFYKDTSCSAEKSLDICFLTETLGGWSLEENPKRA